MTFGQVPVLGPAPDPPAWEPPPLESVAKAGVLGAQATPWIDTNSREAVRTSYDSAIVVTQGVSMSWTGNIGSCAEGTASSAYRAAVIQRLNWFRGMAGVPDTAALDTAATVPDAKAALMMSANRNLSHSPPSGWLCYSAEGAAAAGKSNLCLLWGIADAGCILTYMRDSGANNGAAGHRRWMLYPQTTQFGTGDVSGSGTYPSGYPITNALQVIQDSTYSSPRPATRHAFVAWPPPGYVPYQTVYPRWHFSYPNGEFSNATVTMTQGGSPLAVAIQSRGAGAGENSIVWAAAGLDPDNFSTNWPQPAADTTVRVTVGNVIVNGTPQSFTYDVIIFDPGSSGEVTLTAPSNPSPATGATGVPVSLTLGWTGPAAASSYDVYFGTSATPPLATTVAGTAAAPAALQPNTTYYWRVVARNGSVSASSPLWWFTTAGGTSGSGPAILAPSPGQIISTGGVTFAWSPVSGSGGYNMRITAGSSTVFEGNLAGGSSASTLVSLGDGSYSFAVRSCVGGFADQDCGPFTAVSFTVNQDKPSTAPTITAPQAGAAFTSSTQQFTWTPVAGAARYEILLRDMSAGGVTELSMANAGSPPASNTTFSMKSSAQYRLEVRACTSACGPWSAAVNFSVSLPPVPTQAPAAPACGVSGNQLDCAWNPVPNADLYVAEAVQAGAGPGGGALTVASNRGSATSASMLVPTGSMQILVKACNGNGCGPYGPPATISVAAPNPAVPVLGNPVGGSIVTGPMVFFSWNRIPGDNGSNTVYRLYVQDFSLSRPALDILTRNNYWAAMFRGSGNRYDALVIANPGPGEMVGPARPFHVQGSSPGSPTLVEPRHQDAGVNRTMSVSGNAQLGWTPIPGAVLYEYYVAKSGDPVPVARGITPGLNVQVPLAGPGQYSGIVRSCPAGSSCTFQSDANWGPWSNAAGGTGVTTFQVQ